MKNDTEDPRLVSRWALPGSLAAHLLVALLVIFGLPLPLLESEEEQAVNVDLVPPPEPPQEAEPPLPPPPPEKPEEQAEAEPPPARDESAPPPPQVINPVFQFGEKDGGPREARDGNSADDGPATPEAKPEPEKEESKEAEKPQEPPALTASKSEDPVVQPDLPEVPEPTPPATEDEEVASTEQAKKLFSQNDTDDVLATAAMANVPRDVRAGRLCVTELREQLRNSWPPYYPDLLPSFRLEDDTTVIDAPKAAFRVNGEWYDLSYRCEVDRNATRVTAFAFRVGDMLPPAERQRRRLP